MFVIEDIRANTNGEIVGTGFYGGPYNGVRNAFCIQREMNKAYGFDTQKRAQKVADYFNQYGYHFVVRRRQDAQNETMWSKLSSFLRRILT